MRGPAGASDAAGGSSGFVHKILRKASTMALRSSALARMSIPNRRWNSALVGASTYGIAAIAAARSGNIVA